MRWDPAAGHVPRGFFGATAGVSNVELVLVVAEPGDPMPGESHTGLDSAYEYAMDAFRRGRTLFHQNVRYILDRCWPGMSFDDQLKRVWMTESILCSASFEGGRVGSAIARACGSRFLRPQLTLMPHAVVAALGGKARERLRLAGISDFIEAASVAPPGCNFKGSRESWDKVAAAVRART